MDKWYPGSMPKHNPMDGAKARLQKVKTQTCTAKEAVQRMFSAVGHIDTKMTETTMEEAPKLMQDVSETASDMEMEEKKESKPLNKCKRHL